MFMLPINIFNYSVYKHIQIKHIPTFKVVMCKGKILFVGSKQECAKYTVRRQIRLGKFNSETITCNAAYSLFQKVSLSPHSGN